MLDECLRTESSNSQGPIARRWRVFCVASGLLAGACAYSTQISPQEPSASAQLLLVRSLDRAIAQLDVGRFAGRRVDVELITQGGNRDFANELVKKRLRERGLQVSADAPEQELQVFATVLGTDRGETLVGIPATYVPIFGIGSPRGSSLQVGPQSRPRRARIGCARTKERRSRQPVRTRGWVRKA